MNYMYKLYDKGIIMILETGGKLSIRKSVFISTVKYLISVMISRCNKVQGVTVTAVFNAIFKFGLLKHFRV